MIEIKSGPLRDKFARCQSCDQPAWYEMRVIRTPAGSEPSSHSTSVVLCASCGRELVMGLEKSLHWAGWMRSREED